MEFQCLGPLEIRRSDGMPIDLGGPQQRLVVAQLLSHANTVVSTDRLIDAIWGEAPPASARKIVQGYVSQLRKTLPSDVTLESRPPGYILEIDPDNVDAARFESLLAEARDIRTTDKGGALKRLDEALGLWRGSAYADFAYEEFAHLEAERLEELRRGALEERFEILLAMGKHQELVPELERLTAEYPTRERLWGHLALALYRSGRQAEAVAAFQQVRSHLGDVGLDLSPPLRELEDRILTQDPSLLVEATVPERLRGYVLRGRIGEGAHGVVWRASQPGIGREVAIKAIRPELANQASFVRRFEAEAQLIAALEHPHIVSLFDFWRDPDGAYLVMPYMRGGSLADRLEQGPLDSDAALQLLQEIGAALTYAHQRGVVHRDVTPHNVLLDDDDNAYLADFGVATLLGEASAQYVKETPSAAYLSPELLAGERGSPACDVFSLGALTEAVLGNGAMPPAVDGVIGQAKAASPGNRYGSIDAFLAALADAVGGVIGPVAAKVELRNPYKGLRAFGEADAPDFFGRDRMVAELVDVVGRHRLVGVVGPSGCGKSSLVRAGLIPKLRRRALPGSERWLISDMYPGTRPFAELESALLQVAVDRPGDLEARLVDGDWEGLVGELLPRDGELLLLVDQFEELFTVTGSDEHRRRFLDVLVVLASDPRHRVRVVVTMRADFYDRPLEYPEFAELLRRGLVSVAMPGRGSMIDAVVEPARAEGLEIEAGLAEAIVGDVADQPGRLPLLEYALTELFRHRDGNRLTGDGYRRTGGVLGALGSRAEELYQKQDVSGQEAVRQVFLRLVTVAEGVEDTRRRIPLGELQGLGIDGDVLEPVLDTFVAHRLLTFDRDPENREPTVEVAHEALLDRWERLRTWIDDRRDDLVLHRRLASAVDEWRASGDRPEYLLSGGRLEQFETFAEESDIALSTDETEFLRLSRTAADEAAARRRRRRRLVLTAFASAAMIAAVLAVVAFVAQQRAEREASVARARDLASSAVLEAQSDPLLAMNLAVLAVETLPEGEEPGPALETALRTAKAADRSAGHFDELGAGLWTNADLSPDGSTVAVAHGQQLVVFDSATMEVELWSYREPGPEALGSVAFSSDGEYIVASVVDERDRAFFLEEASEADGSPDPRLLVFNADSGELVHTQAIEMDDACQAWAGPGSWRSDLGLLGVGVSDCDWKGLAFQFIDTTTWEVVYEHPTPPNDLPGVDFALEGTQAAMFSGWNAGAKSWLIDTADWSIVRELEYPDGTLSPDGSVLAGVPKGAFPVVLEEADTGVLKDRLHIGDSSGWGVAFSPAGDILAIGTLSESTFLFDAATGELIDTIEPVPATGIVLGDKHLYISGSGVVSKWHTTEVGMGDLNTVPLGLSVAANSILWTSNGTVMADTEDNTTGDWTLYPVDQSTGDLGEPIPYGSSWLAPLPGNRAVMFRFREAAGVTEHGPLEVVDLSTGEFTPIVGCWMDVRAALAHEPCPDGVPHPAGQIAFWGSKDGTEFLILDPQETEAGETEVFASIWETATFTETTRLSLGVHEGSYFITSILTEDYIVLHTDRDHKPQVRDRATGELILELDISTRQAEHDRTQNRIWMTGRSDTELWLLDLDTLDLRPVTGHVADIVWGIATSPSGELVAAAAGNGYVRIYSDEGELRHSIPLPNPSDAWWLDEETLVVGTGNGPWTVITLDPDRLLGAVKASLRRGFTEAECSLHEIDPCPTLEELQSG